METGLERLLDFQRFERNAALQGVIDGVLADYYADRELSDEELETLAAAGDLFSLPQTPDGRGERRQ